MWVRVKRVEVRREEESQLMTSRHEDGGQEQDPWAGW